jgi:hypothetical protein
LSYLKKLDVFLSSDINEFSYLRKKIKLELNRSPFINCKILEDEGALPVNVREASLEASKNSDIYIGIFGKQYSGITVEEYNAAKSKNIPIFIYIKKIKKGRQIKLRLLIKNDIKINYKYEPFISNQKVIPVINENLANFLRKLLQKGIAVEKEMMKDTKLESLEKAANNKITVLNSWRDLEISLKRKLAEFFDDRYISTYEEIFYHASRNRMISKREAKEIIKIRLLRNSIIHNGYSPSDSQTSHAKEKSASLINKINKLKLKYIEWVASFCIEYKYTSSEDIDEQIDNLKKYIQARVGNIPQETDYGEDGEFIRLRLAFKAATDKAGLIKSFHNWILTELKPLSVIYSDENENN